MRCSFVGSDQGNEMSASSPRASPKWSWTARFCYGRNRDFQGLKLNLKWKPSDGQWIIMKQEVTWQVKHLLNRSQTRSPLFCWLCLLRLCCRNTVPSREQRDASFGPPNGSKLNALQSTRLIHTL